MRGDDRSERVTTGSKGEFWQNFFLIVLQNSDSHFYCSKMLRGASENFKCQIATMVVSPYHSG